MKIALLITLLESLAIASWLILRRFRNGYPKTQSTEIMIPVYANATDFSAPGVFSSVEVSHGNFINNWQVEDQANDRGLTRGAVAARAGSGPEQRSFARRSHQRSFKTWSQARHD
ncbi:MAG: hypothetical protein QOF62_1999 [Pyrinomonadaceae bacterium]|jgi:hypothetical protein|nr:hypothetical protein [Pyrinomonadaceae bacterium]